MADGFHQVKSKSRKKRPDVDSDPAKQATDLFNRVERCKQALKDYDIDLYASKVIFKLKQIIQTSKLRIICYGLGSFDENLASRYQFALLLLIKKAFEEDDLVEETELFDPQFSEIDTRVIKHHYGLALASTNEKAMKACDRECFTLFYMPHCPKALYNNLLYANWSKDRLNRIILFGNSFSHLQSMGVDPVTYSYLSDSFGFFDEIGLEGKCECTSAFSDLSLHVFRANKLEVNQFKSPLQLVYDAACLKMPCYSDKEEIIQ